MTRESMLNEFILLYGPPFGRERARRALENLVLTLEARAQACALCEFTGRPIPTALQDA